MNQTGEAPPAGSEPVNQDPRGESGQGLAEYALILAFVALACVAALTALGSSIAGSSAWTIP